MARKKSQRLEEVYTLPNVFTFEENNTEKKLSEYFGNDNKICLEIGCGHGDYSIALSQKFPDTNFVGLDMRATRVYIGAKEALNENHKNAAFIVARADQLPEIFSDKKIDEIWIPFPDSLPRRKDAPKRLISTKFLEIYKKIISPDGVINFKTDDLPLFEFACKNLERPDVKILKCLENLHDGNELNLREKIQTLHEKVFLREGRIIKYIQFQFLF